MVYHEKEKQRVQPLTLLQEGSNRILPIVISIVSCSNTLLQQKSAQMHNNLAEQQENNNNKAKTKQNNKHKNNSLDHYPKF